MYAIVEVAGKQYKIEKDAQVLVDRLESKTNDEVILDKVLLFANGEDVRVGQPYVAGVKIKAINLGEVKGEKVMGIKFGRRKNHQRTFGHRETYTQLKIADLVIA